MTENRLDNQLRLFRDRAGLTLSEMAAIAGCSVGQIQRVEAKGYPLGGEKWERLATYFGVSVAELMHPPAIRERVLILGSQARGEQITGYEWTVLPPDLELKEFRSIIVILDALSEEKGHLSDLTQQQTKKLADWLFLTTGELIFLAPHPQRETRTLPVQMWLPFWPQKESYLPDRQRLYETSDTFDFLWREIEEWGSAFRAVPPPVLPAPFPPDKETERTLVTFQPLAKAATGAMVSFEMRYHTLHSLQNGILSPAQTSCPIVWLPAPTKVSAETLVTRLLEHRYGLRGEIGPPAWTTPLQIEALRRIEEEKRAVSAAATKQLAALDIRASRYHNTLRLLYETSSTVLEACLRDGLESLGCRIHSERKQLTVPPIRWGEEATTMTYSLDILPGALTLSHLEAVSSALLPAQDRPTHLLFFQPHAGQPLSLASDNEANNLAQAAAERGICLVPLAALYFWLKRIEENRVSAPALFAVLLPGVLPGAANLRGELSSYWETH